VLHEIQFGSTTIGELAIQPVEEDDDLSAMMSLIASEIGGPIRIATLVEESRRLARYDPLTGILNRRAFVEHVIPLIDRASGTGSALSCVLFDLDHFKNVNDTYGHRSGDRVLTELGRLGFEVLPKGASLARWGGEEFVMALPDMDHNSAFEVAESLRQSIESLEIMTEDAHLIPVTASLGVAALLPNESFESLVERADRAMYAAKVAGRNRVEVATEELIPNGERRGNSLRSRERLEVVAS